MAKTRNDLIEAAMDIIESMGDLRHGGGACWALRVVSNDEFLGRKFIEFIGDTSLAESLYYWPLNKWGDKERLTHMALFLVAEEDVLLS